MSALRCEPLVKLASGGMATVFVGALRGALDFRQIVAIKRPHPHLLEDPKLRDALLAEARVASRIHHANVVDVRDVEVEGDVIQLVMDYVEGAALGQLIQIGARGGPRVPPGVAVRVVLDACAGLHAAHELADDAGAPLGVVHRDVSPQNILVGTDGVARVTDFGVAKVARADRPTTTDGSLKGKIGYMAPEYVRGRPLDRRADVFALGVVLWEALAHKRLFRGSNEAEALDLVLREPAPPVSAYAPEVGVALDAVIARAVEKAPEDRFESARAFAEDLEAAAREVGLLAGQDEVARHVRDAVGEEISERRRQVRDRLAALDGGAPLDPLITPAQPAPAPAMPVAAPPTRADVPRPRPRRAAPAAAVLIAVVIVTVIAALALAPRSPPPAIATASASITPPPATTSAPAPPPDSASATAPPPDSATAPPTASATAAPTASARAAPRLPAKRAAPAPFPSNPYR